MTAKRRPQKHRESGYFARHYTWRVSTQTTRNISKRRIEFRNPAQFIHAAAAIVRSDDPFGAIVGFGQKGRYRLWIHCGWDESGDVSTHIVVPIDKELAMLLAQYLMTHGQLQHSMVASDFERSDDDGGEELPLPTVSEAELAAMVPSVGVQ